VSFVVAAVDRFIGDADRSAVTITAPSVVVLGCWPRAATAKRARAKDAQKSFTA
jgi:hypothetical protein